MAPKKAEAKAEEAPPPPPPPKVEEELQGAIVSGDSRAISGKLAELKTIADRFCRVVLYLPDCEFATQTQLTEVIQSSPAMCCELSLLYCDQLVRLPDISHLKELRCLNLNMCLHITALPPSVSSLIELQLIDVSWCEHLASVPDLSPLTKLVRFDCVGCRSLKVTAATPKLPPTLKIEWNKVSRTGLRKPDHFYPGTFPSVAPAAAPISSLAKKSGNTYTADVDRRRD